MLTNTLRYRYMYMLICNVSLNNLKNNNPEYLEKLTIVFIKSQGTNRFIVQYFFFYFNTSYQHKNYIKRELLIRFL